jgi:hypothetical protein
MKNKQDLKVLACLIFFLLSACVGQDGLRVGELTCESMEVDPGDAAIYTWENK